jgi:hypothetical protein
MFVLLHFGYRAVIGLMGDSVKLRIPDRRNPANLCSKPLGAEKSCFDFDRFPGKCELPTMGVKIDMKLPVSEMQNIT